MLSYTFAQAIDNGQDALVAGQPASVQNSYAPNAENRASPISGSASCFRAWLHPSPFIATMSGGGYFQQLESIRGGHSGQREANKRNRDR